jgi:hypothetical protein
VCLKEGSRTVTISYADLWMKQGQGDDYLPASLTS